MPLEESVGELARLRAEGKVAHVGLSNVSVREIERGRRRSCRSSSVQNRWSPTYRGPEQDGVLAHCAAKGIALLPYSPFGGAGGARSLGRTGRLAEEAARRGVSPHRLVIAWMLAKSPVVIPIPGARRAESVVDCAKASDLALSPADVAAIAKSFSPS